jgi:hypothetical protein
MADGDVTGAGTGDLSQVEKGGAVTGTGDLSRIEAPVTAKAYFMVCFFRSCAI